MYSSLNRDMYLWQHITWKIFHKLALNQDFNKNIAYETFFNAFKTLILFSICRNHYISMLNEKDYNLKNNINSKTLFNFTIDIHNNVNIRTNRKYWNYEQAFKHYKSFFLTFNDIKRFINIYIFHNYKKGPEKTNKLFEMLRSLTHIFPRHKVREKLLKYQQNIKPNKLNFHKWIKGYLFIIKSEM